VTLQVGSQIQDNRPEEICIMERFPDRTGLVLIVKGVQDVEARWGLWSYSIKARFKSRYAPEFAP